MRNIIIAVCLGLVLMVPALAQPAQASDWDKPEVIIPLSALLIWGIASLSDQQKHDLAEDLSDYAAILSPFLQKALKWAGVQEGGAAADYLTGYLETTISGLIDAAKDGDEALYAYLDEIEEPALKQFIASEGGAKWLLGLIGRIDPRLRDALWRTENGVNIGVLPEAIQLLYARGDLPEPTWAAFVNNVRDIEFTDADLQWFIQTLSDNLYSATKEAQHARNPNPVGNVSD